VVEALLQGFGHTDRVFFSLIITADFFCFLVAVATVKQAGVFVGLAYLELAALKTCRN